MDRIKDSILVVGAGELGTAILTSLCAHPKKHATKISAMIRPQSLSSPSVLKKDEIGSLQTAGIEIIAGDLETSSVQELASDLARYDTVISCSGMTGSSGLQVKIARAAVTAKVRRFVPWQYGIDYDLIGRGSAQNLFTEQLDVRDVLRRQSQTQWLIFSVGVFLSFVFVPAFGMVDIEKGTVRAFGAWDNSFTTTTVQDIGRVVAEAVYNGSDSWANSNPEANGIIFIAGDTLTYRQLADNVEQVSGKPIKRELWTVEAMKERLRADPENGFKKYGVIWAEAKGVAWNQASTFNAAHNMAMTTVKDWATKNL